MGQPKHLVEGKMIAEALIEHVKAEGKKLDKKAEKKAQNLTIPPEASEELTSKQIAFAKYYVENGFNGTQAAIKAGYSENSAKAIACENLTKPDVKKLVTQLQKEKLTMETTTPGWKIEKLRGLTEILAKTIEENPDSSSAAPVSSAISRLIAEMNKMQGHYAPEKTMNLHAVAMFDDKLDEMIDEFREDY